METQNWVQIVIVIFLLLLSGFFAGKWTKAKHLLKQIAEALTALSDAIDDNKITIEELQLLRKEFFDVIEAAKELIGK